MKYMGSKAKYIKYILPIILKDRQLNQLYIEPFVGMGNMIYKVNGNRIGSDINPFVINLLKAIQEGWEPPDTITEEEYHKIKEYQYNYHPALVAFVAIGCSYSGKIWGGYARGKNNKGEERNYCLESKKNLLKQKDGLNNIIFKCCDYRELEIPSKSIIYADPPYVNTTKYKTDFNNDEFWQWCNNMINIGHKVFVSEYQAPKDWICVWEKEVCSSLTKETGSKKATERLFTKCE